MTVSGAVSATTIDAVAVSQGGDEYTITYNISNDTLTSPIEAFELFFGSEYSGITAVSAPVGWNIDAFDGFPIFGSFIDGSYLADTIAGGILQGQSLGGFALTLAYTGTDPVGLVDYDIFNPVNFGLLDSGTVQASSGGGGTATVPEPGVLALLFSGAVAFQLFGKRRRSLLKGGAA